MKVAGRVWKFGADVNTDLIFPNIAFRLPEEEQIKFVFRANRPGWVEQVRPGDIIIGGRNFGTGSSRPAATLLKRLELGGLAADSVNGLFFRNCVNCGLPAVQCPGVSDVFEEGDTAEIDIDAGTVRNLRTGQILQGIRLHKSLIDLIGSGGVIPLLRKEGYLD